MKKYLLLFMVPLFAATFSSCEEDEAALIFSTENISNPNNVKIEYYSPDPCCVAKMYWIHTNSEASRLTIKCINSHAIFFENTGIDSNEYTSPSGNWHAALVDSNTVVFTFDKIDGEYIDASYSEQDCLNIAADTKKGKVSTGIYVIRLTHSTEPI